MLGEAAALGAAVTWSLSVVLFQKSRDVAPAAMNLFKNVVGLTLLGITMVAVGSYPPAERDAGDWIRLAASGVLGIAIGDTLIFAALRRLGASTLAIVDCAYAPLVIAGGVFWLDEKLGPSFWIGATLVCLGLLGAVTGGKGRGERSSNESKRTSLGGVVLGLLGIAAMAIGIVMAKPVLARGSLVEVTTVRLLAGVVGQLVFAGLVPSQRKTLTVFRYGPHFKTLLPASILGAYVSMLLWLAGFKWTTVATASVLNQLSTVSTMMLAWWLLGERPSARKWMGAACAVGGALLVVLKV